MNKITPLSKNHLITLSFLLFSWVGFAQLTVNVTVTDETCPGYGALSLSVSNAGPSAPVVYKVYLLPEDTIPVWNSTETYVPALGDGDYLIVATQETGDGNTSTGQANATIASLYAPIEYYISNTTATCNTGTDMTVTVTAGDPATYEIVSGPVTASPQTSNVFSNLPSGTYEVLVTDACGNGFTTVYSFVTEQTQLTVSDPALPDAEFTSCNSINVLYTIGTSSESGIIYPLNVVIVVTAPDNTTQTYTQNISSGNSSLLTITEEVDYYPQSYPVTITVTDPCGNEYTNNGTINKKLNASATISQVSCNAQALTINAVNFSPPFTITFNNSPDGFDPSAFNPGYPGPYTGAAVFGDESNPVPLGTYSGIITDNCGRTDTFSRNVGLPEAPTPNVNAINNNCQTQLGRINISVPNGEIVTATMTVAPSAYNAETPMDVTAQINASGRIVVNNLPPGNYVFAFTDSCGNIYENISGTVPQFSPTEPEYTAIPDCQEGYGTVMIDNSVAAVTITSAPSAFANPLPYTASANIIDGVFSMDGLPAGNYTFSVDTACETGYSETLEVTALTVEVSSVELQPTCENFNIYVNYDSNADDAVDFWLQRYNDVTDSWEHPYTGSPYVENDELTADNALSLTQSTTGLTVNGEFRVLKQQKSFSMGTSGTNEKNCIEEINEFEYFNELAITAIYNRTCVGEDFEVEVYATGVSPRFEIISKDGDATFYVDNCTNPVFTGLQSALYVVRVTDACGEFRVEQFNIAELPPLITASVAEDMSFCDEAGTGTGTFDLSLQNDAVLGDVDPDIAIISYHASQADADEGINALPENYTSGSATIYARVEWITNPLCYGISSFNIITSPSFDLTMEDIWGMCNGQPVTINADPGYAAYSWSTGETTESITVTEPGEYTVTVTNTGSCTVSKTVSAVVVSQPLITNLEVEDWSDDDNSVMVMINQSNTDAYEYSFDGINYQDESILTDIPAGMHIIYVRDKFGCYPPDSQEVMIATYPKYFSPNGDGNNDTWRIRFAVLEPGLSVQIFDRYGKHITNFGATSEGWDGTFNGYALPADDYWFIVKRGDGREFKGHFSIVR